jgi:hypothetical protein
VEREERCGPQGVPTPSATCPTHRGRHVAADYLQQISFVGQTKPRRRSATCKSHHPEDVCLRGTVGLKTGVHAVACSCM